MLNQRSSLENFLFCGMVYVSISLLFSGVVSYIAIELHKREKLKKWKSFNILTFASFGCTVGGFIFTETLFCKLLMKAINMEVLLFAIFLTLIPICNFTWKYQPSNLKTITQTSFCNKQMLFVGIMLDLLTILVQFLPLLFYVTQLDYFLLCVIRLITCFVVCFAYINIK